jgi:Sec-independent protein secretion pathway component TatC
MAVPIIILYETGIWASRILNKKKKPVEEKKTEDSQ